MAKLKQRSLDCDLRESQLTGELFGDVGQELVDNNERKRKPVWIDEDDLIERYKDNTKKKKKKKLKMKNKNERDIKKKFTDTYGAQPDWAKLPSKNPKDFASDTANDAANFEQSTGIYLASSGSSSVGGLLPKTELNIKSCKDLNGKSYSEGSVITCCEFNPKFEVAFVAGYTKKNLGAATLFQVDGKNNHIIQSVKFPNFPIKCGGFLQDGRRFVVGSSTHPHFFAYDMDSGKQIRMPWNGQENSKTRKVLRVSQCGRWLAFLGTQGVVDIYDAKMLSFIESFKVPGEATAIAFSIDGNSLYALGDLGKVFVFDMSQRCCIHSFYDSGCLSGISIDISCQGILACGSSSGIVNIYNKDDFMSSESPSPIKVLSKLVTPISNLRFNHTGEILATSSSEKEEALRLVHLPSATYFANFPGSAHNFSRVNSLSFSPGGGFLSIGNNKATAKLYRLHHYNKY